LSAESRSERAIEITSVADDDVFEEVSVRHYEELRLESGRRIVVKGNRREEKKKMMMMIKKQSRREKIRERKRESNEINNSSVVFCSVPAMRSNAMQDNNVWFFYTIPSFSLLTFFLLS